MAPRNSIDTRLPPPPRRRRGRGFNAGRALARLVVVVLALFGALPILAVSFIQSAQAKSWATRETTRILAEQGITAHFKVALHLWPLSLELDDVRVDSSDGGAPFLTAAKARVRPRVFALMSGKLLIDEITIDAPRVRLVVKDGKLANLAVKLPSSGSNEPIHMPFEAFAISDGDIDATVVGDGGDVRVRAHQLDVDVTTEDDRLRGSSMEIRVGMGPSTVTRERRGAGATAFDDDSICSIDARLRVTPDDVTIHRIEIQGAADLDPAAETAPPCNLAQADPRRVELELNHVHAKLPKGEAPPPDFNGHVHVRLPVAIAARLTKLPEVDGWVAADADVRMAPGMNLPEVSGHVSGAKLRIERYHLAETLDSEVTLRDNVIRSAKTTVKMANGTVILKDVHVEPLAKTLGVGATDIDGVDFAQLMRDLGVAAHPHVTWDIAEVHMASFGGTLDPVKLDGDFTAVTKNFGLYDRHVAEPSRQRLVGFSEAKVGAHLAIRPDSVQFKNAHGELAHSHVEGGFVLIGFDNKLRVEVPKARVGLADITPLASLPIAGEADVQVHVGPDMGDPKVTGDGSVTGFSLAGMPFGNVTAVHAELDGEVLTLKNVKAQKNKSTYEMPQGTLDFSAPGGGMKMDGLVRAITLDVRDVLDVFQMNEDPRFEGIYGNASGDATFHLGLGGREDECGKGLITVHASPHLSNVELFGEKFDDGDADLDLRWRDRDAGFAGADLQVHAFTLHKVRRERDGAAFGSLLGSLSVQPGGVLHGNVVLEGVPLSRLQTLGSLAPQLEGTVSGIAQLGGTIDSFTAEADVDVSPVHIRAADFGASKLHVTMTQLPTPTKIIGKTRCGAPMTAAFDKEAYVRDTSSHGTYVVKGDLLGGQVHIDNLTATRAKQMEVSGLLKVSRLALGSVVQAAGLDEGGLAKLKGEISGDLYIDHVKQGDFANAAVRFAPHALSIEDEGKKLVLAPTSGVIALASGTVTIPPLDLDLAATGGVTGSITLKGAVKDVLDGGMLDIDADLKPLDLSMLAGVVPKLDRATGSLSGTAHITGRAEDPQLEGDVKLRASELFVRGLPAPINDVEVDLRADASQIRVARGVAKFAGGTLMLGGRVPIRNLSIGNVDLTLAARNVRLSPADGISAGLDADLELSTDDNGVDHRKLPHLQGEVVVASLEYTRPINLAGDLTSLGSRAKRTEIETYDPSQDALTLDLRVRAKAPLRIKNNLVDAQIALDSGALVVSGTNQRIGLRGEMHALSGGRLRLPFGNNVFEIKQGIIRFDDPTRIAANVDLQATTEYRRTSGESTGATSSSSTTGTTWRIALHAYGDTDDLKIDLTSEPQLSKEDIVLLLTIGITQAEAAQLQAGSLGTSVALEALSALSGASTAINKAVPIIDDFKFGSAYSPRSGRSEPTVTVGKSITKDVSANVSTSLSEDRELYANVMWRLGQHFSVRASYDNVNNDVTSSAVGNLGVDLRWRIEFQ